MRPLLLLACLALAAGLRAETAPTPLPDGLYAEFTTPHGRFVAELYYQQAPLTVGSFVGRAETGLAARDGRPFFTGLVWYRVVPDFVLQSGDPVRSAAKPGADLSDAEDAAGHPLPFPDEFVPGLHHDTAGVLSMANAGPDTNSSEFFVTLRDTTRLNYLHSVFGRVIHGLDLLPRVQPNEPFSIRILRVGAAAQAFRADETAFKERLAAAKPYAGPKDAGPAAPFDDPDKLLPTEPPRAKNFAFKLANFERATGRKVYARLFAKSPTPAEDAAPGAFMRALAEKLGTARDGVLAVYFADEKDWRVWIGDAAVPAFLGRAPAAGDLGEGGALHDVKTALIDAAVARGDADFAAQQKAAPADRQPPPGQRIKLQADALLDALLLKLEPK